MTKVSEWILMGTLSLTAIGGVGCAKEEKKGGDSTTAEFKGWIAKIDGEVRPVEESELKSVCATHTCEPNYIYTASMGKKKPKPPKLKPSVTPAPSVTPSATPTGPDLTGEKLDYAKAILKLPDAWKISQGSRDVVVAVVDTGVDINHKDLKDNLFVNTAEKNGKSGVDDDGNGFLDDVFGWDFANNRPNAIDDNEHGTHCAGIIGAEINGSGTAGVSPLVRILPVKFLDSQGSGTSAAAIQAIQYATKMGARVISNSWGGGGRSELLNQAIQEAISKGILVVAAAGNESSDNDSFPSYPASYDGVISVASSDQKDQLSDFSNFGKKSVEIAAPGSDIYSTLPGGGWGELSGTSMATPQVSGALALALSVAPKIDASVLKSKLCESADPILRDQVSCGRMNVLRLLQSVMK